MKHTYEDKHFQLIDSVMDKTSICIITIVMALFIILIASFNINWGMLQDDECLEIILANYNALFIMQGASAILSIIIVLCCDCFKCGYQFWVGVINCVLAVLYVVPISSMILCWEIPNNDNNVFYMLANAAIVGVGAIGLISAPFIAPD